MKSALGFWIATDMKVQRWLCWKISLVFPSASWMEKRCKKKKNNSLYKSVSEICFHSWIFIQVKKDNLSIIPRVYFNCTSFTGKCIFIKNRSKVLHKYFGTIDCFKCKGSEKLQMNMKINFLSCYWCKTLRKKRLWNIKMKWWCDKHNCLTLSFRLWQEAIFFEVMLSVVSWKLVWKKLDITRL